MEGYVYLKLVLIKQRYSHDFFLVCGYFKESPQEFDSK